MGSILEAFVNAQLGGWRGITIWGVTAALPPLVVMSIIGRQVAPRTLSPMTRRLVWTVCLSGLVLVWIKTGVPAAVLSYVR